MIWFVWANMRRMSYMYDFLKNEGPGRRTEMSACACHVCQRLNQEKCATQEFKKVMSFEIESSESSQFTSCGLSVVR